MRQNVPIRGNGAFQGPWVEKLREGQFGQCGMRRDWEDEARDAAGPGRPFNDLGHKTMRSHGM